MSSYVTLPDGSRCYSGPNCLRHSKRSLPADFSSKPVNEQLADMEKLKNPLSDQEPKQVDEKIAELYEAYYYATSDIGSWKKQMKWYQERLNTPRYSHAHAQGSVDMLKEQIEAAETQGQEILNEVVPYEVEFRRRGGWTRGFLVNNSNGHVHKSRSCSTCTRTTQYMWLTEYSGKDESELVSDAGEKACTVCYPSAPVDVLSRPPRLKNAELEAAQAQKAKAAEEKARKAAVKAAKVITAPDGSELRTNSDYYRTTTAAESAAADIWATNKAVKEGRYTIRNPQYVIEKEEDYKTLITALAHKNGRSFKEQEDSMMKKFESKYKRDWL